MTYPLRLACVLAMLQLPLAATADVEKTIEYRQSVYRVIAWNFGPLRAMAQGKIEFDAAAAKQSAERIAAMAGMLDDAYAEKSTASNSDAKPLIWEQWDDFETKLTSFQTEADSLAATTADGDEDAVKAQFVKLAGTCKACHDDYKD